MIRTIISDIGNVLSGFTWYDFYKSKGYSEEMVERLAKATVGSDIWKEYDRGVLSEEEILNRFIANDPELEEDLHKTLANVRGIMERYRIFPERCCGSAGAIWIFCRMWMAASFRVRIS